MNKYHRVTHTPEEYGMLPQWDVPPLQKEMNKYYPLRHKLTPPDTTPPHTATTRLAPIHLRVARMVLWVLIFTCESSPTTTHTAVSERLVPLFCSVAQLLLFTHDINSSPRPSSARTSNQTCVSNGSTHFAFSTLRIGHHVTTTCSKPQII
jgi:hypothetical protein